MVIVRNEYAVCEKYIIFLRKNNMTYYNQEMHMMALERFKKH